MKNNSGWGVLLGIHFLFFCLAIFLGHTHLKDSNEYLQQSVNIWTNGSWYCGDMSLPINPALYSQRPPLYGLFLVITNWKVIGEWFPLLIQGIFSFYNCVIAYLIYKKITGKEINVIKLFWPLLFFVSQFVYANSIMSEILFQSFWLLAIYFAICFIKDFKTKDIVFHQLAVSAAFLVKPIAYAFPLISTLGIILLVMQKKVHSKVLSTTLIPFFIIGIILILNYNHTAVLEYSSIQRKLMINYNMPLLLSKNVGEKKAFDMVESVQQNAGTLSYVDRARFIDQQCLHWILESPLSYFELHIKGVFRFFLDHGRWDLYSFLTGVNPEQTSSTSLQKSYNENGLMGATNYIYSFPKVIVGYLLLVFFMNIILLISFIRFLFLTEITKTIRIIIAVMVLYLALLTGPTGSARFRVPVYPILLVTFAISSTFYISRITRLLK